MWIRKILRSTACLLAGLLLITGCRGAPQADISTPDVPLPPSLRTAEPAQAQLVVLDEKQAGALSVQTVRATHGSFAYALTLPGTTYPAPDFMALVSAPISGRVVRVHAHEGEAVRSGQVLLELESLEFASLVGDYMQAWADETYQRKQVERLQLLVERQISPRSALEKTEADLLRAQAMVQAAQARLQAVGVSQAQLERWRSEPAERPLLRVHAPISGVINEHLIDLGQAVTAYERMMSIVNLEQVLIRGYVSPEDAPLIRAGDPVQIGIKGFPERVLEARIATINPALDEASRSVTVNILARPHEGWPMPGQSVRLQILVRSPQPVLMLPLAAVTYDDRNATVFVRRNRLLFEKRAIEVSRITDEAVIIAGGLAEGEEVAVSQVFSLKALGRYEQYAEE